MVFANRSEAGQKLAERLLKYASADAVVLTLPRGGVVTGYEIAHALALPLDIIAVRKIGHPFSPEYAIGVVDDRGNTIFNETEKVVVDQSWLKEEVEQQKQEAKRRSLVYREGKKRVVIDNKIAIIADDGIATGLTMQLAVRSVKAQNVRKIIVAVPVASAESIQLLKDEGADEIMLLESPDEFRGSVGAHYAQFDQVEDDEVVRLIKSIGN